MAETGHPLMATIRARYKRTHVLLLDLVADMTNAELRWQPHPPGNSTTWMTLKPAICPVSSRRQRGNWEP